MEENKREVRKLSEKAVRHPYLARETMQWLQKRQEGLDLKDFPRSQIEFSSQKIVNIKEGNAEHDSVNGYVV